LVLYQALSEIQGGCFKIRYFKTAPGYTDIQGVRSFLMELQTLIALGAGIAVVAALGAGIGIGIATSGAAQAISRQPEAAGKITPLFFLGVALAESTAIYGLVIAILLFTKLG
jgi:F-type H+-transporting ATPase subunit c